VCFKHSKGMAFEISKLRGVNGRQQLLCDFDISIFPISAIRSTTANYGHLRLNFPDLILHRLPFMPTQIWVELEPISF
jgi:hypothetical protein